MKILINLLLVLGLNLVFSPKSLAQVPERLCDDDNHKSTLGTDFAAWAMGGYSIFYSSLSGSCRIVIETWKIVIPDSIIELNSKNKGEGWNRTIDRGYSMYLDTFYTPEANGWYSGMIFSTFESTVTRDTFAGISTFRSYEILLRFGYKWDLGQHFSIEPWFAAGPLWATKQGNKIGDEDFSESGLQVISTVHLNYQFN